MTEPKGDSVVVDECPECGEKGRYDGRVLVGGRGIYTCPNQHRWQDADEKPSSKGFPITLDREAGRDA